ncbi:hypothetical protein D3C81_1687820 [compost metagenome]
MRAGGENKVVVADCFARGEQNTAVLPVNGGSLIMQQIYTLGGEELGGTEQQVGRVDFAEQIGF